MRIFSKLTPNKSSKPKTITRTTEYGYYIRRKTRIGKKRRQKTNKLPKNSEKVIIDKIGDLEFYVYPYSYPDKLFIGIYPLSTMIGKEDFKRIFGITNKIRWYLDGEWTRKAKRENATKFLRQRIVRAYKVGLDKLIEAKNDSL